MQEIYHLSQHHIQLEQDVRLLKKDLRKECEKMCTTSKQGNSCEAQVVIEIYVSSRDSDPLVVLWGCCNADTDAQISQTLLSSVASSSALTDLFHFTKRKHPRGKLTWKKLTPFISSQFSAQAAGCIKSRPYFSALFCRSCGAPSLNCYDRSLTGWYFKWICLLAGIIMVFAKARLWALNLQTLSNYLCNRHEWHHIYIYIYIYTYTQYIYTVMYG